ncbi:MAG: hypothetical protein ACM3MK_14295 [Chitinophagales bacterium]
MKLQEIYDLAIKLGIEKDVRNREQIDKILARRKKVYDRLDEEDKEFFDKDSLFNPFNDTRILFGDPGLEITSLICGIDMETPEVVLADRLREKGTSLDLVLAHHPEGIAQAGMHGVMNLQADLLYRAGIPINVAESILSPRISEVERNIMPQNHQRAVDAARLLDMPFMCVHTPADNLVNDFLQTKIDDAGSMYLDDLLDLLCSIPECSQARMLKAGPRLVVGDKKKRAGKVMVDMAGGTSGSALAYEKMETAGVGTVVSMHMPEKHRENASKHNINVIIAGHMASDSLGMNLFLDYLEERKVNVLPAAGLIRVRRNPEGILFS